MKKAIVALLLTVLAVYVIIICVNARSGSLFLSSSKSGNKKKKEEIIQLSGEKEIESGENISSGDLNLENGNNIEEIENMTFNESGRIIIAMYHKFAKEEGSDEWCRSRWKPYH